MDRSAWHRKASRPVSLWLAGLLVLAFVHRWVPQSRWLLVHMFTLGMVTNSILVWGQHFADALLRTNTPDAQRQQQVWRIRVLNLGIVVTCVGMVGQWPWVTVAGASNVGVALCWYALALLHQLRRALPARFGSTVGFYAAAAFLLPLGATFGGFMAFSQPEPWQGRLLLAHQLTNIGGFVGLTAVGTLVTLWPTVLRTKMEPGQDVAGLRALVLMALALTIGITGALTGLQLLTALGVALYLAGLVVIGVPLVRCAVRKPPRDFPAWSIGAGLLWFVGCQVALLARLLGARDLVAADLQALSVPFLAGFGAQLLFGAMSYLMPTVMGGGPSVVRAATTAMNRFGALRVASLNAALLAFLTTDDSWTRVLTSLVAFVALASFVPLLKGMVKASVAARRAKVAGDVATAVPGAATVPAAANRPSPTADDTTNRGRRDFVEAGVGIAGVLSAVALGRSIGTSGGGRSTQQAVRETGHTTEVTVTARDMRFHPETVDVPPGDRLVITLVNDDPSMVHDLYLDNGTTTGRVEPGQKGTLEAGVIGGPVEGWCTIVGHRSMGMVFRVTAGGAAGAPAGAPATSSATTRLSIDLSKAPGSGFTTRDARLGAMPLERTQRIEITCIEQQQEVAPGFELAAMTFNGRVMGPLVKANLGDSITAHLVNKGTMGHSLDFHAGTVSPDRNMRTIAPGESLDYTFVAHRAGIWLYHCSTMPMSTHIAAGMYGAVVVPPKNLARVQREYVLVQQEIYLTTPGGPVDSNKIADEKPDLTMWNGHANQYVFAPLEARVGERVRIWVLAAGPSRGCSFHVVGAQFDTVFKEGAYLLRPGNAEGGGAQALDLASCQGGFVEMVFTEPGSYTFVNHSFVEMERGARGLIKVS